MKFLVIDIKALLQEAAERACLSLDYSNFSALSEFINDSRKNGDIHIKEDYLYKNIYRKLILYEKQQIDFISLNSSFVNQISKRLGYKSFDHFTDLKSKPIHPILLSCVGSWFSYLRRNTEKKELLRSPVSIYIEDHDVKISLSGPINEFKGTVSLSGGCIFCLFKSKNGKEFHHVYKIGIRKNPQLLQGIFSGASSGGEPIGGRVLLIRNKEEENGKSIKKILLDQRTADNDPLMKSLLNYFTSLKKNNLRIDRAETFDLDDIL